MNVAHTTKGIVEEGDVATGRVAAKGESGSGILQLGGESKYEGIVSRVRGVRSKASGVVFETIVGLDTFDLVLSDNVRRVLLD